MASQRLASRRSGVHWDMLCDMRDGGEIGADGRLIYRAGTFMLD